MTTRELLYIKTIADEGSMTRAAQKLFVTQPSLSHCVMNIEQQLGTPVVHAHFRRADADLCGRKILPHGLRSAARLRGV